MCVRPLVPVTDTDSLCSSYVRSIPFQIFASNLLKGAQMNRMRATDERTEGAMECEFICLT